MLKYKSLPKPSKLVYDGFEFKEKPPLSFTKLLSIVLISILMSCSFVPVKSIANDVEPVAVIPEQTLEDKMFDYIKGFNKTISDKEAKTISDATVKWSAKFGVSPMLVLAVQQVESGFNKFSISSTGALGYMQFIVSYHHPKMKDAMKEIGTPEPFDGRVNIYVGTWVLRDCMKQFKDQTSQLRCYSGSNATPNGYEDKVRSSLKQIRRHMES